MTTVEPWPFAALPKGHFQAILADPPWRFATWSLNGMDRAADNHYATMSTHDIVNLPVGDLAAEDCVLFLWTSWPHLKSAMYVLDRWQFTYKTCAFDWMKTTSAGDLAMGLGYWTRANTEPCLLATRGKPRRIKADVRQAILAPRREHSRKPDIYERIERLVPGPYLELWARQRRPGWSSWGDEVDKFTECQRGEVSRQAAQAQIT
jgi:N6-adenosine-specific RNA methylase IME4